jgi:hypothetical protein
MATRICAAGVAALLGIASAFVPAGTSAGPAGLKARSAPAAGFLRAPAAVRPHTSGPLRATGRGFVPNMRGGAPHQHHRQSAGFGVTGGWGGYGAYYDPSNYVMLHDQPPAPPSPPAAAYPTDESVSLTVRVIPPVYDYRLGCQSQTQNVPAGAGERAITIMRC